MIYFCLYTNFPKTVVKITFTVQIDLYLELSLVSSSDRFCQFYSSIIDLPLHKIVATDRAPPSHCKCK